MSLVSFFRVLFLFLAGISLIATIHELGHFLMARLFKMRVKRFMIFFPPKLFSKKVGFTEYGIGSVPVGGFVEIAGMEEGNGAPQPYEFRAKPAWQRFLVMAGGVLFNLISAYLFIFAVLYFSGVPEITKEELNGYGIVPSQSGQLLGFQKGDQIEGVNGSSYRTADELLRSFQAKGETTYQVKRGGKLITITVTQAFKKAHKDDRQGFFSIAFPIKVHKAVQGGLAYDMALQRGDQIVAINGLSISTLAELRAALKQHAGQKVVVTYTREGKRYTATGQLGANGQLGIEVASPLSSVRKRKSFGETWVIACKRMVRIVKVQGGFILKLVTGQVSFRRSVGGPISMARTIGQAGGFSEFFWIIALLSIMIALMNLLPIPALDGGHLLLLLAEMVSRRKVPKVWKDRLQQAGSMLLMALLLFLLFNDLRALWSPG